MAASYGDIGTGANGSTSVAPSYPSGITAGQYLLAHVTSGTSSVPTDIPDTPSGWTLLGSDENTDGNFGTDSGRRRATVFGKEADGTESGTLTITITNGNTTRGSITRWEKGAGETWSVVAEGANDSTAGTDVSMTFAAIEWLNGDVGAVTVGQRIDTATQSSQSLTATGVTFGTITNRASNAVNTGADHRHVIDTFDAVTDAPTAESAAATWSYTASVNVAAGGVLVRLRATAAGGTQFDVNMSGATSSTGTVARQTAKPLAGAATSSGTLARQTGKALAGALASSGALTTIKAVLRSFTGAMASAGTLTRQTGKPLSGSATPAGALARLTAKAFTGTAASSGALSTARVVLLALAGAVSSAGALTRRPGKALTGASSSSGALTTAATFRRSLAGTMASGGVLARRPGKGLAGVLTSSGAMSSTRVVLLTLTGAMASTGTVARQVAIRFAGTLTSAGSLARRTTKALAGLLSNAGQLTAILLGGDGSDPRPITLTIRDAGHTATVADDGHTLGLRDSGHTATVRENR